MIESLVALPICQRVELSFSLVCRHRAHQRMHLIRVGSIMTWFWCETTRPRHCDARRAEDFWKRRRPFTLMRHHGRYRCRHAMLGSHAMLATQVCARIARGSTRRFNQSNRQSNFCKFCTAQLLAEPICFVIPPSAESFQVFCPPIPHASEYTHYMFSKSKTCLANSVLFTSEMSVLREDRRQGTFEARAIDNCGIAPGNQQRVAKRQRAKKRNFFGMTVWVQYGPNTKSNGGPCNGRFAIKNFL